MMTMGFTTVRKTVHYAASPGTDVKQDLSFFNYYYLGKLPMAF